MYYHAEVWFPEKPQNKKQAEAVLDRLLGPYHEENNRRNGFYDFLSIGGRWTGAHDDYDPTSNPLNYEGCRMCGGFGKRPDMDCSRSRGCNGCMGTGMSLKWPTLFVFHEGDIMSVEEAEKLKPKLEAYTIVIAPTGKRKRPHIIHESKWNGKDFEKTLFNGQVFPYLKKKNVRGGCLITVDYHC